MYILLNFTVVFLVAYVAVRLIAPVMITIALQYGIVDKPDGKLKCHQKTTPYLGGIVVFIGIFVGYVCSPCAQWQPLLVCGLLTLLITGLFDDIFTLSPSQKLIGQIAASFFLWGCDSTLALFCNEILSTMHVPICIVAIVGNIIVIVWYLCVINAFNLIDIMDGLAATLGCTCAIGLALAAHATGQYFLVLLSISCCGALVGFLYFNYPVADMYLGDTGSMLIGGILAYISGNIAWYSLNTASFGYYFAAVALFLIFFIPIFELLMLIMIRSWHGIPFFRGSKHHFIHYLRKNNFIDSVILKITFLIALFLLLILQGFLGQLIGAKILLITGFVVTAAWIAIVYIFPKNFWIKLDAISFVALDKVFRRKQQ